MTETAARPHRSRPPVLLMAAGFTAGLALTLGACAVSGTESIWTAADDGGSAYGDYLAGLWADASRSPEDAARFYRQALEKEPGNAMLLDEAFSASLLAADWAETPALAAAALQADPDNHQARLALAVDAMADRSWRRAARLLEDAQLGPLDAITASILEAWSRAAAGDAETGVAGLADPDSAALFSALVSLHQAMLMDRAGDPAAEASFRSAMDAYALPSFAVREYGRWLERQGREEDARAVYRARLDVQPEDATVALELGRLAAGGKPDRTDPREASALALYGAAAALMGRDFSDRSQTYLELALRLDPDFAPSRLLLGQLMMAQGRPERAGEMFSGLEADPAYGVEARILGAQIVAATGDDAAAEAILRELWQEDGGEEAALALADALRANEQWAEAEALLTDLIESRAARGAPVEWRLFYGRAVVRERQDDWPGAEADFRAAIALEPEDASLLNYLGYSMVDRGVNLEEGFQLIRRAVELEPRAGYIIDSLGWAYYKLGDYQEAVGHLERAAALQPGAADINDHLGDAYWRVGRRLEARFQWERALTLEPDDALRAAVTTKLASGLPPAGEAPALAENR